MKRSATAARRRPRAPTAPATDALPERVAQALADLRARATHATRDGMPRFAIPNDKALGVKMADIQALAKRLGRDHALAQALWATDVYEARLLVAYVAEPDELTSAQMDAWCRDFDNWAVCDTLCFALFDRSPLAWNKVATWARRRAEFEKRAAFALLAGLALHRKTAPDAPFLDALPLIEAASDDARNFVKKAVNWALRAIGRRRSPALRAAARATALRLAASEDATARWIGKDALRQFDKDADKAKR